MKSMAFLSCIISTILVSLYPVAGYPNGDASEKLGVGWGAAAPTNGITVAAGQTIVAGNASATVASSDNVDVLAYNNYGGGFEAENTMSNTGNNVINVDFMEANVPVATGISYGTAVDQDADAFSQTTAIVDDVVTLHYSQKPNNMVSFSAGTMGVNGWVTATDGTILAGGGGGSGSGWKAKK